MKSRPLHRALLILDYGPSDKESGSVYDLTALVVQCMNTDKPGSSRINISITGNNYDEVPEFGIEFGGWNSGPSPVSPTTDCLIDVVNHLRTPSDKESFLQADCDKLKKALDFLYKKQAQQHSKGAAS